MNAKFKEAMGWLLGGPQCSSAQDEEDVDADKIALESEHGVHLHQLQELESSRADSHLAFLQAASNDEEVEVIHR